MNMMTAYGSEGDKEVILGKRKTSTETHVGACVLCSRTKQGWSDWNRVKEGAHIGR